MRLVRGADAAIDDPKRIAERFLRDHPITSSLLDAHIEALSSLLELHLVSDGELIVTAGSTDDRVYLVESGSVVLERPADEDGDAVHIANVEAHEYFGELQYLDGRPTAWDARAIDHCRLWSLSRSRVERDARWAALPSALLGRLMSARIDRDGQMSMLVADRERTLRLTRAQRAEAIGFAILVTLVFAVQNTATAIVRRNHLSTESTAYRWGMLGIFMIASLTFARIYRFKRHDLGLVRGNLKVALVDAAVVSGVGSVMLVAATWWMRHTSGQLLTPSVDSPWLFALAYLPHVALQELGARGVFQGVMDQLLGKDRAILVCRR